MTTPSLPDCPQLISAGSDGGESHHEEVSDQSDT